MESQTVPDDGLDCSGVGVGAGVGVDVVVVVILVLVSIVRESSSVACVDSSDSSLCSTTKCARSICDAFSSSYVPTNTGTCLSNTTILSARSRKFR